MERRQSIFGEIIARLLARTRKRITKDTEDNISENVDSYHEKHEGISIKIAKIAKIEAPIKPTVLPRLVDAHEFEIQFKRMEQEIEHVLGEDFRNAAGEIDWRLKKPIKEEAEEQGTFSKKYMDSMLESVTLTDDECDVLNSDEYAQEIKEIYKQFLLYKNNKITREAYEAFKDDCLAEYWENEPRDSVYQKQMKALRRLEL